MPVVDAHVHLYPPEVNADPRAWAEWQGESHWAMLCTRLRKSGRPVQGFPSLRQLLDEMDDAGVDQAVLLGWYWENPGTCTAQNRFLAAAARAHPDRLRFFASVYPAWNDRMLDDEFARLRDEGCCGLGELSPHTQGLGPAWGKIFARAGEMGWPVNLHVTDPESRPFPGRQVTPLRDFLGWAKAYPRTNYILAHWAGGGGLLAEFRHLPNVWLDTAASPLLYSPQTVERLLASFPSERVLWGSDHPLDLYPADNEAGGGWRRFREALAATPGYTEAMTGTNLLGLLARVVK